MSNRQQTTWFRFRPRRRRHGVAMLMCLFVIFMITVWLVDMLSVQTVHMSAVRNTLEYEQSLYLANAGVHHAAAELEADTAWRSTVSAGSYPASGSYQSTGVDGSVAGTVDITSIGVAGEVTRTLTATITID